MSRGRFITVEGIDGAGKSSHIEALAGWLRGRGHTVLLTREPGGTPLAEQLRGLFLSQPMDALTETLLVFAGRRDHVQQVIAPALAQGHTVLCDRFTDATFAYQGGGRGFDSQVLGQLERWVQATGEGFVEPDLTLWFDLAPALAAQRRAASRAADRLEQEDLHFFDRVRAGYAARAQAAPTRFSRIAADQSRDAVWAEVLQVVAHREASAWR
jgi:dTMP kinase